MTLPFTIQDFIMYFNIAVLAIMALFAIIGFLRGTFKSVYYMIATLIIFVGGWLIADKVCNILLDIDLSTFNLSFDVGGTTYNLTTAREMLTEVIKDQLFGGTIPEDSLVVATVFALIIMIVRIIYFIIIIILSFTVFKILFDIIWLIIKPRRRNKEGKKVKPGMVSRLGGLGIGAVKGLMYTLLMCFLFAGTASIASNLMQMREESSDTTDTYTVVIIDDTATLVKLSTEEENESNNILDEYSQIFELIGAYRETIAGQVFGSIKISEASLDEYVFDGLFSLKIENGEDKYDIKLRKELQHAANALMKIGGLSSDFSMEKLANMDRELLEEVIDELTSLELINVAVPVGIEIVLANEAILAGIENESLRATIKTSLSNMKGLDYMAEIKEVGFAFVDVVQLLEFADGKLEIDFLTLDADTVESIFDRISKLGIVDAVAPLLVEYLCSMESIQQSFEDLNINLDELLNPQKYDPDAEPIKWSDEISNIGKVYKAFRGLGLKTEDFENMNFAFTDEQIAAVDGVVDAIFNSRVVSKAVPVLVDVGKSKLPEEYATIITIGDDVDWSNELKPLLKSALVLFSSGLFEAEGEMTDRLGALDDDKIDQLSEYFSQSGIIKTNLNALIDKLLGPQDNGDGTTTDGIFGGLALSALDSPDEWTKLEISSIFKAVKEIVSSGIIGSDDILASFGELSDESINNIATHLSNSKFIRKNLSGILTYFMDNMNSSEESLTLVSLDEDEWTSTELSSIFKALQTIATSGLLNGEGTDGIKNLSDESIDKLGTNISASKFLTRNLTEIMDMLLGNIELGDGIEIHGFENAEDWTKVEIVSLLKGARLIVNYTEDLTQIVNLSEDELDILLDSKLISNTLISFIKAYAQEGKTLEVIKGVNLVADDEWKDTNTETTFTLSAGTINITPVAGADKYYIYLADKKVASTTSVTKDLSAVEGLSGHEDELKVYAKENGEIRKLFVSIQTLLGSDFNSETLSNDIIKKITALTEADITVIIASKLVSETIICKIEEFADPDGGFLSIPEGELTALNLDGSKDRTAWNENGLEHGELFKVLRAISVIFNGKDIGADSFEFSTDLITNIDNAGIEKITASVVVNESLIKKIEDMANESGAVIYIPSELQASPTKIDRAKWQAANESASLLKGLKSIFAGGEVDTSNMKLSTIIDQKDEILRSLVITETVKQQATKAGTGIIIPSELPSDTLDGWKNTYDVDDNLATSGEISNMLAAVDKIIDTGDTNITDINVTNINLDNIITNQDIILKSLVITATVKDKVTSFDGIVVPENEGLSSENLNGWKNTYNASGEIVSRGEIAKMLNAIKIVLNVDSSTTLDESLATDNINLENVITNKNEILKSLVITATFKDKISNMAAISVPNDPSLSTTDLSGWKNTYDASGNLLTNGEIAHLLDAIDIILNIDSSTKLDDFSTDSIKLGKVIYEKDIILKSLLISNVVKEKIMDNSTLELPSSLPTDSLVGWKSTYDSEENVSAYGELAYLLTAVKYALNITSPDDDANFNNINVDTIKLNNLIDNRQTILHSSIIALTIKTQILNNASTDNSKILRLPENYEVSSSPNFVTWNDEYNDTTYNALTKEFNYTVTSLGELDRVLAAIGELLADTDTTFSNITSFNYANLFVASSQEKLIASKLLSETIIQKIGENSISVPNDTDLRLNLTSDRTNWWSENGELKYFLSAIGLILNDSEKETLSVDLDVSSAYAKITNEATRTELFKSYLIAETLTVKFSELDLFSTKMPTVDNSGINLSATNTDGSNNRDDWYIVNELVDSRTIEHKELWNLVTSIHILLGDSFDTSVSFSIDQVLNKPEFYPSLDANKINTNETVYNMLYSKILEETFVGVVQSIVTGDGVLADYLNVPSPANWYLYLTGAGEYDTQTIIESIYQMQAAGLSYSAVASIATAGVSAAASAAETLASLDTAKLADAFVISRTYRASIEKFFNGMLATIYSYAYTAGSISGHPLDPWNSVKLVQSDFDGLSRVEASALLKNKLDVIIENLERVY